MNFVVIKYVPLPQIFRKPVSYRCVILVFGSLSK